MSWFWTNGSLLIHPLLICTICCSSANTTSEPRPLTGRSATVVISKPGQMALAPSGDRLAVADRFANSIQVLDTRGVLLWSVGENITLDQPQAVQMTKVDELVFTQWQSLKVMRVCEKNSQVIDTLHDFASTFNRKSRILRLYGLPDNSHLLLIDNPEQLIVCDSDWSNSKAIVKSFSSGGKLAGVAGCVVLPNGRLAVAGASPYPVQLFDRTGKFITKTDWNSPVPQASWMASAVAIDHRERIWVADPTNLNFRRYDLTGTLIDVLQFTIGNTSPIDMAISSDNQLFVLNANGRIDIYDLGRE